MKTDSLSPSALKQSLFFPFKKGWPVVGTTSSPEQPKDDPEEDSFYQTSPVVTEFDAENGRFINNYGAIAPIHQQLKTGYLFVSPKIHFTKTEMILADCYSGTMYFFDRETKVMNREMDLFEGMVDSVVSVNENEQHPKDEILSRLQQIIAKKSHFPLRLVDFCMDGQNLYGIVANDDNAYFCSWSIIDTTPKLTLSEKLAINKDLIQHVRFIRKDGSLYSIYIVDLGETLQLVLEKRL